MKVIGGGGISVKGERSMELVAPSKGQCLTKRTTQQKRQRTKKKKKREREREKERKDKSEKNACDKPNRLKQALFSRKIKATCFVWVTITRILVQSPAVVMLLLPFVAAHARSPSEP